MHNVPDAYLRLQTQGRIPVRASSQRTLRKCLRFSEQYLSRVTHKDLNRRGANDFEFVEPGLKLGSVFAGLKNLACSSYEAHQILDRPSAELFSLYSFEPTNSLERRVS
jgi:hypothetical protein